MQCFIFLKSAGYFLLGPLRAMRREWRRCRLQACGLQLGPSVNIYQDPGCKIIVGAGGSVGTGTLLIAQSRGAAKNHIIIGERVAINEYNNLRAAGGDIRIGNHCQIAQFCTLVASNHTVETAQYMIDAPWETSKVSIDIEEDVWIGANCVILPGVTIGRGAVIGAGAVVTKDVPAYSIYVGNPARFLRSRQLHA
jgi:carbonic anhydrase/acetyltransferase-like protein (isoleucine patch superfamily)